MKSKGKIRQKYKQVRYRSRANFLEQHHKRKPCNCIFKKEVSFEERENGVVLCGFEDENWDVLMCTQQQAMTCPKFHPAEDSDDLKDNFNEFLEYAETTGDLGPLAYYYPDLAAMLWVLSPWEEEEDDDNSISDVSIGVDLEDSESSSTHSTEDSVVVNRRQGFSPWQRSKARFSPWLKAVGMKTLVLFIFFVGLISYLMYVTAS